MASDELRRFGISPELALLSHSNFGSSSSASARRCAAPRSCARPRPTSTSMARCIGDAALSEEIRDKLHPIRAQRRGQPVGLPQPGRRQHLVQPLMKVANGDGVSGGSDPAGRGQTGAHRDLGHRAPPGRTALIALAVVDATVAQRRADVAGARRRLHEPSHDAVRAAFPGQSCEGLPFCSRLPGDAMRTSSPRCCLLALSSRAPGRAGRRSADSPPPARRSLASASEVVVIGEGRVWIAAHAGEHRELVVYCASHELVAIGGISARAAQRRHISCTRWPMEVTGGGARARRVRFSPTCCSTPGAAAVDRHPFVAAARHGGRPSDRRGAPMAPVAGAVRMRRRSRPIGLPAHEPMLPSSADA